MGSVGVSAWPRDRWACTVVAPIVFFFSWFLQARFLYFLLPFFPFFLAALLLFPRVLSSWMVSFLSPRRREEKRRGGKAKIIIKRNENMVIAAWLVWSDDCCFIWNCFSPHSKGGSEPSKPIGCQDVVPCCWAPIGTTTPPPPQPLLATSPRRNV